MENESNKPYPEFLYANFRLNNSILELKIFWDFVTQIENFIKTRSVNQHSLTLVLNSNTPIATEIIECILAYFKLKGFKSSIQYNVKNKILEFTLNPIWDLKENGFIGSSKFYLKKWGA